MSRLKSATRAALIHLFLCGVVAALFAGLVFGLWYPAPFAQLAGGTQLLLMVLAVDLVLGPLLTLVVFNPSKPKEELRRDIGLIVLLQVAALLYGAWTAAYARPILLGYEGDRFRLVTRADVDDAELGRSEIKLGWSGPEPIGVKLLQPSDDGYKDSVLMAAGGVHPSFRPERWLPYATQAAAAGNKAHSIALLSNKYPDFQGDLNGRSLQQLAADPALGYQPLAGSRDGTDWVVVVDRSSGEIRGYLPLDGWQ